LHPSNEVAFMTTALSMVSARLGITACLPYATSLVRLHQLQMRPLHEPELRRTFQIYMRSNTSPSPAAAKFMEFLFAYVASHGWNAPSEQAG
ncbi:MAG: LysR substrate-binding domain-containing protein, partial [Giesbergeria sp.]